MADSAAIVRVAAVAVTAAIVVHAGRAMTPTQWLRSKNHGPSWCTPSVFPPSQDLPVHGSECAEDRLQGFKAFDALRVRARQDRAERHHRRLRQEAARTRPRHQALAFPRSAALRDPVKILDRRHACRRSKIFIRLPGRPVADGWGSQETSNRSKGAGQLMIAIVLIAIAAGCASALMFASIISGALISLLLFYLAPLPLMVAALGWGPLCATIGGITAATVLGLTFGLPFCVAFAVAIALPAWWLGHLALLGRPFAAGAAPSNDEQVLEWYPVGRILLWIVIFAAIMMTVALIAMSSDGPSITQTMRAAWAHVL